MYNQLRLSATLMSYIKSTYLEDVLTAVIQQSRYLVFYDGNTSILCYDLKSLGLNKRTNFCIRVNTRELNRELFTK